MFTACRAIPTIAFPWVRTIYMYIIYSCVHLREYALYMYTAVKEVASFLGAQSINRRDA